ncbi:hypothetical protein ACFE04_011965 [Oxalis oulophora]
MGFELGIIELYYGGSIITDESKTKSIYEGGNKEEISIDLDETGYADVRNNLKEKGYNEYCFRVYFQDPNNGLARLHSDDNSSRLVELINAHRIVTVYVEHGAVLNKEYVSFDNWANSVSYKEENSENESDGREESEVLVDLSDGDDDDDDELQKARSNLNL